MLNKTKKVAFLTSGLAGALVVSSAAGVALSSCTTTNTSNNTDSSNKYTYAIDWTDQDQVKQLTIDEQGLVYSSASKTEIIAVAPNTAATSVVIPASVKYITGYNEITKNSDGTIATSTTKGAFQGLVSLISVTFASDTTLVSIGDSAFSGCTYLSTISLPSSTSVVYNNAFLNCTNLRSINLVGVSYIGSSAFQNAMANGAGVSIDLSSASYIGDNAFNGCTSLVKADFSSNTTLSYIGVSAFNGAFVNGDSATTLDLSKATTLKTISDSAFAGCTNLTSVVLSSSSALTTIGANAFSGASNLTQVGSATGTFTAPSSLGNYVLTTVSSTSTSYVSSGIGANAFSGTKIATIDLSAVTATTPLGNAAFKGMTALTSVNFGSSKITTIPYSLFENDTALTTLTLPSSIITIQDGTNNSSANTSTNDYTNQRSPFYNSGLKTVDMSAITSYATGQTSWWGATIDSTTMVPVGLFQNLTSLTSVVLKKGTVVIGSDAFSGASALKTVKEGSTSTVADTTAGLIIPSTLEMINVGAFEGTGIESITFADTSSSTSNSLWFLGKNAFKDTTALTLVDLFAADTTNTHKIQHGAMDSTSTTVDTLTGLSGISAELFSGSTALKTVKLPTSITQIYTKAFVNNTALTSVNFDALTSLHTISTLNFTDANALSSIDLSGTALTTTSYAIANLFTGLPSNATVKLSAAATSLNDSSFLIQGNTTASASARPTITYSGTGLNLSLSKATTTVLGASGTVVDSLGSGSSTGAGTYKNPMLQYVSNDYDLTKSTVTSSASGTASTGANIGLYYPWTFFGNTKLTGLTMSASNFALQGTDAAPTQATSLFNVNATSFSGIKYNYHYVPFGGNTALKNFTFTGFDVSTTSTAAEASTTNNPLAKTTLKTWAQVGTIINKFAANSLAKITAWPSLSAGANADSASNIQYDSVITNTAASDKTSYTFKVTDSYVSGTSTGSSVAVENTFKATLDSTETFSFVHNGVTWTLTITPSTTTSTGSVTLVGKNINIYKGDKLGSTSVNAQIPFATTTTNGTEKANTITVTLNII